MRSIRSCIASALAIILLSFTGIGQAFSADNLTLLIPAGRGGGWDSTAREAGNTLEQLNLVENAKYINMSGNGGGRALNELISNPTYKDCLMVQSLPLIMRNVTGQYEYSFQDIIPAAIMIAEYQVVVVQKDSPFTTMQDLMQTIKELGKKKPVVGGSAKGSLDHITALAILEAGGVSTSKLRYSASNGGGDAIRKFSTGYALAMVTGLGEVIDQIKDGDLRVLGVTSEQRIEGLDAPTLKEQGIDVVLANWRGFFTSKDIRPDLLEHYKDMLATVNSSPEWKATRQKYGWEPFYLTSNQASAFLVSQERTIRNLIQKIDEP